MNEMHYKYLREELREEICSATKSIMAVFVKLGHTEIECQHALENMKPSST
jgi:hypothetical protein